MSGQHEKGTPLRFSVGTHVEVRISPARTAHRMNTGMIAIQTYAGVSGWVPPSLSMSITSKAVARHSSPPTPLSWTGILLLMATL